MLPMPTTAMAALAKPSSAHDDMRFFVLDAQDGLGRVSRLHNLAQTGQKESDADSPEHKPLGDQIRTSSLMTHADIDDDGQQGKHEHQCGYDDGIHKNSIVQLFDRHDDALHAVYLKVGGRQPGTRRVVLCSQFRWWRDVYTSRLLAESVRRTF